MFRCLVLHFGVHNVNFTCAASTLLTVTRTKVHLLSRHEHIPINILEVNYKRRGLGYSVELKKQNSFVSVLKLVTLWTVGGTGMNLTQLDTTAFSFSLKPAMCAGRIREQTKARLDNANT